MKKKSLFVTIILLLIAVFAFSLTACFFKEVSTLESLKNEYGIVVDGGSFEEGSTLVSNEIVATTEDGAEVLTAIADQNYDKDGSVYIFDIYVTKDGAKVQPNGKVNVSIPITSVSLNGYVVFHIKDSGKIEELTPILKDNKLIIEIESFSYFVVAQKPHTHSYDDVVTKPTC